MFLLFLEVGPPGVRREDRVGLQELQVKVGTSGIRRMQTKRRPLLSIGVVWSVASCCQASASDTAALVL